MSVAGVEAVETVLNSSIIARRREIAVRINATETTSHRKKTTCNVRLTFAFSWAQMRLSLFARGLVVEPRVRQLDLISSSALHDRTLQHGASPPTMGISNTHAKRDLQQVCEIEN